MHAQKLEKQYQCTEVGSMRKLATKHSLMNIHTNAVSCGKSVLRCPAAVDMHKLEKQYQCTEVDTCGHT